MRCRIVEKLQHEGVPLEGLLHDATLHAHSAAMNDPHFTKSCRMRLVDVLFDDRGDIARREGMQVELAFNGDSQRLALSGVEGVLILHFPG